MSARSGERTKLAAAVKRPKPPKPAVDDTQIYAALDDLYTRIPAMECRGKCQGACGPIAMSAAEQRRMAVHGTPVPNALRHRSADEISPTCPALTMLGTCGNYPIRPIVCRLWGAIESMSCSYGCRPEGGWLSEQWGVALLLLADSYSTGKPMTVDQALAEVAHLTDPEVLKAWLNMRAAGSNPYSDNIREATNSAFVAALARWRNQRKAAAV